LRSRISGCERAASAHTLGSEIFSSMEASADFRRVASKILPQLTHLFADWGVGKFKVGQHSFQFTGLPEGSALKRA
jgi:hypothetical protein